MFLILTILVLVHGQSQGCHTSGLKGPAEVKSVFLLIGSRETVIDVFYVQDI